MKVKLLSVILLSLFVIIGCSSSDESPTYPDYRCHTLDVTVQVIKKDGQYLSDELQQYLTDSTWQCKIGMVNEWLNIAEDGTVHVFVSETWDCTKCDRWYQSNF